MQERQDLVLVLTKDTQPPWYHLSERLFLSSAFGSFVKNQVAVDYFCVFYSTSFVYMFCASTILFLSL